MRVFRSFPVLLLATVILASGCGCKDNSSNVPDPKDPPVVTSDVDLYVTTANKALLFKKVPIAFNPKPNMAVSTTLSLKPNQRYQEIDGFGTAITGSTCYNLLRMSATNREALLKELFDVEQGMGHSYIRIAMGCSDFSLEEYTCCDEPGIANFKIHELDRRDLFPILKQIKQINPNLKIMATPWTPPRWMKVNNLTDLKAYNSWTSGQLNPAYYADYAAYFVKFVQDMEREGFDIDAVTVQNEPLNRGNSASLYMTWQEQRNFVKQALGPAFEKAGLKTKIIAYDHNYNYDNIADQQGYPMEIYSDAEAAKYIDGAAYHAYGGNNAEMLKVHNRYPDKNLYFTEMSIGTWNYSFDGDLMWSMKEIGIGTLNNFSKAVIVWNLMLDEKGAPNRPGGCTTCYGAVDISSSDWSTLDRKSHYYLISHLSKVIRSGATRIGVGGYQPEGVYVTAAINPDNSYGAVLQNDTDNPVVITIADEVNSFTYTLPSKSLTSCKWKKE